MANFSQAFRASNSRLGSSSDIPVAEDNVSLLALPSPWESRLACVPVAFSRQAIASADSVVGSIAISGLLILFAKPERNFWTDWSPPIMLTWTNFMNRGWS